MLIFCRISTVKNTHEKKPKINANIELNSPANVSSLHFEKKNLETKFFFVVCAKSIKW